MEPITKTEACKLTGFSKERVTKALSSLTPASKQRRIVRYDAVAAIRACIHSEEAEKDRELRLKADILQVKLARMENEQIDLKKAQGFCQELLIRLSEKIRYTEGIARDHAEAITDYLRIEANRLADDLAGSLFDNGEVEVSGGDEE